jgi:hypothetical protein
VAAGSATQWGRKSRVRSHDGCLGTQPGGERLRGVGALVRLGGGKESPVRDAVTAGAPFGLWECVQDLGGLAPTLLWGTELEGLEYWGGGCGASERARKSE